MLFTDHDRLDLKDLNEVIRHEAGVATKWYDLGVELLDSNTAVLDVIQSDHQSSHDRCRQMFQKWLEMKLDASWSQLVTALNKIGLKTAADNVHHNKMPTEGSCCINPTSMNTLKNRTTVMVLVQIMPSGVEEMKQLIILEVCRWLDVLESSDE